MEGLPTEKTAPVAVRLAMEGGIVEVRECPCVVLSVGLLSTSLHSMLSSDKAFIYAVNLPYCMQGSI